MCIILVKKNARRRNYRRALRYLDILTYLRSIIIRIKAVVI